MCFLCDEYGDGGIWYFNPKNYARNMYKLRQPGEGFKGAEASLEAGGGGGPTTADMLTALEKGQYEEYERIRQAIDYRMKRTLGGQVVPLKHAEQALELCSPIALISCACRRGSRAIDERNELEYTCMGMGAGMLKWERWPERYKGGAKFVTVEEAKKWNRKMDKRGFVHMLMLFGVPYIGGLCQCDYPGCSIVRSAVDFGISLIKGHFVAMVDYDLCNGCGVCVQRCQFGALKFEVTTDKANIDQFKCYGCGLCETSCPRKAIKLLERVSLPALAEVW